MGLNPLLLTPQLDFFNIARLITFYRLLIVVFHQELYSQAIISKGHLFTLGLAIIWYLRGMYLPKFNFADFVVNWLQTQAIFRPYSENFFTTLEKHTCNFVGLIIIHLYKPRLYLDLKNEYFLKSFLSEYIRPKRNTPAKIQFSRLHG